MKMDGSMLLSLSFFSGKAQLRSDLFSSRLVLNAV